MSVVVLHRLTDWPVFRHLRPLLAALGAPEEVLGWWHYFYAKEQVTDPFVNLPEPPTPPDVEEVLLAATAALATSGHGLLGVAEGANLVMGFHPTATREALEEAIRVGGHHARLVDDDAWAEPATPEHLGPLYDRWELASVRAMLRGGLAKGEPKAALRYIDHGGAKPKLTPVAGLSLELYWGLAHFTERHERILDVFVALTGARAVPRWSTLGEKGAALADAAGKLCDELASRGVSEEVILASICEPTKPGSHQRAFGHTSWWSRTFLLLSWFARLDEVARLGSRALIGLILATAEVDRWMRGLPSLALDRWCRAGGFDQLDLEGLEACAHLDDHDAGDAFRADVARVYRERVLGSGDASLAQLILVKYGERQAGPLDAAERSRFDASLVAAFVRADSTLQDWSLARRLELVDGPTFDRGVVAPFRRATEAEFRAGEHGFGDHEGFVAAAAAVAAHDPDLCLRGWVVLTGRFNAYGLRANLASWSACVPETGFSRAALDEAAAHFSHPARRAEAKILKAFLTARGIHTTQARPPEIEDVDATFEVGTDVAHLIVGSFDAVEAVAHVEDPDDWPAAMKKHKCVGLETGGDGAYVVRVVGSRPGAEAHAVTRGGSLRATFPLVIKDDTLTVSGIVGAGGTPTISFPSGKYAADVFQKKDGDVVVVVRPVDVLPAWAFKKSLPSLG